MDIATPKSRKRTTPAPMVATSGDTEKRSVRNSPNGPLRRNAIQRPMKRATRSRASRTNPRSQPRTSNAAMNSPSTKSTIATYVVRSERYVSRYCRLDPDGQDRAGGSHQDVVGVRAEEELARRGPLPETDHDHLAAEVTRRLDDVLSRRVAPHEVVDRVGDAFLRQFLVDDLQVAIA